MDIFEDILGDPVEDKGPPVLGDRDTLQYAGGGKNFERSLAVVNVNKAIKGVTISWLAKLLGISASTVSRRLDGLVDPKAVSRVGTKYYDPRLALPFLVEQHNFKARLKNMNPKDLPEKMRKEYWSSKKIEQDVRLRAKDLWPTHEVHRVMSDLMKLVKDSVILWTDTIDESTMLTPDQITILDELSRKLLSDFADAVSKYTSENNTPSQLSELDDE